MPKQKASGYMTVQQAQHLLAHALPPDARTDCWRRTFTDAQKRELHRLHTPAQTERLERILPAIAYYTAQGPRLADARAPLVKLATDAHKAAAALRVLLDASDEAMQESRLRLLESIDAQHPERCPVDPARVSFFHRYDRREPEALRLLATLQDVELAASHAVECMPKEQTRAVAHTFPVELIHAALSVDGPAVHVSASPACPFIEIATLCYDAAGTGDPVRAIRAHLRQMQRQPKK